MGDDLTAARRFSERVQADIGGLIKAVSAAPVPAPHILSGYLESVQSAAKSQHARAIYRGAQTVIDAIDVRAPLPVVQGRVLTLNKLAAQYQAGLEEIAAHQPARGSDNVGPPPFPSPQAAVIAKRFEQARAALLPLMEFAQPGAEAEPLKRLANFTQEELAQSCAAPAAQDHHTEMLAPPPIALTSSPPVDVDFETLMPHFTSHALQTARQTKKTVSVSYAAEDVRLCPAQAQALQPVLEHIAQTLVTGVMERPETRQARGESGAGHIAITASMAALPPADTRADSSHQAPQAAKKAVSISIDCPGSPLSLTAFTPAGHVVSGLTVTPGQNMTDRTTHVVLTLPTERAGDQNLNVSNGTIAPQISEIAL